MTRPTILLVEDEKELRDNLSAQLFEAGATVLPAKSANEAIRIFQRRVSEISALVTDFRLSKANPIEGVQLAAKIRLIEPRLPRIGVTAFNTKDGDGVLDVVFEKGRALPQEKKNVYNNIGNIVRLASSYDERRFDGLPEQMLGLKEKYSISNSDFEALVSSWRVTDLGRLAFLTWHDVSGSAENEESLEPAEGEGRRELRVVRAGTAVNYDQTLKCDVPVVTRQTPEGVIAQLFGMPLIFTYAEYEDEAVNSLIENLFDCYKELEGPDDLTGGSRSDIVRFYAYLARAFKDEGEA